MGKNRFEGIWMPENPNSMRLNLHSREKNPHFESHDPSMMKDPVSGWYYSYCTDAYIESERQTGIPIRKSDNLVQFKYVGIALSKEAVKEAGFNGELERTESFWAPYVEYVEGEYRMYYSVTRAFGSPESRIWLAVSKNPEGPFENRGIVMDTWNCDVESPNAIDAHVVNDREGNKYLVYGSFFGGIYIKRLNKETGMSWGGNAKETGKCIAKKPQNSFIDGPEGAAILYQREEDYFYLFYSYGWLGDTYDIRVGRSREVEGPYLDFEERNLVGEALGIKLANSYRFSAARVPNGEKSRSESDNNLTTKSSWSYDGFRGPGHGVPFYDEDKNQYFFVHHIRDGAEDLCSHEKDRDYYCMHYMMVRKMVFVNGWPYLSPEPYAGEEGENIPEYLANGIYEIICMDDCNNNLKHPIIRKCIYQVIQGTDALQWEEQTIVGKLLKCWDFENSCPSVCFTGRDDRGVAYWAKLMYN
ncbi:arabinan endo-1,5-alpha-L-arabinosidase [Anaeromicropila populeti]|uniref:Arabinan endo-1,5-alpha-L-arabinosidase n=1 Tax=Anaeromicropila populeti TaxID=37658 RepID=A0A1I6LP92_9FIRM|nr:arabinan endo-1,5-alpha-L-arabinosidase [Anaeromicropila populeti]SFS05296.1 arabinan endo-1,5-alpha-L-arabinosidase [Anaeromicropila populeti]